MLEIVTATRLTRAGFDAGAPLGLSLERLRADPRLKLTVFPDNQRGLSEIYNERIAAAGDDDILVFLHDDVWIEDFYVTDRIIEALGRFDVVGLAGNSRRQPGQRTWVNSPTTRQPDLPHLRGAMAHGDGPLGRVQFYGPNMAECELLDGVLLAARRAVLVKAGVRFDPQFDFHYYDLDFCRTARQHGLRLGVWPIAMTHRSGGAFGSDGFKANQARYLAKWGD